MFFVRESLLEEFLWMQVPCFGGRGKAKKFQKVFWFSSVAFFCFFRHFFPFILFLSYYFYTFYYYYNFYSWEKIYIKQIILEKPFFRFYGKQEKTIFSSSSKNLSKCGLDLDFACSADLLSSLKGRRRRDKILRTRNLKRNRNNK